MKIALKAVAATALLCLSAFASAAPDTTVRYFREDLSDVEPGKDRWVFHYTVSAGSMIATSTIFRSMCWTTPPSLDRCASQTRPRRWLVSPSWSR
jgi:hypothetical protein